MWGLLIPRNRIHCSLFAFINTAAHWKTRIGHLGCSQAIQRMRCLWHSITPTRRGYMRVQKHTRDPRIKFYGLTDNFYLYCHVWRICVTNNNGFWIGWLDLLALLYNQLWQLTINDSLRLAPFLAGLQVSSLLRDWLGSDLRIGRFFSFRSPLVNTPQLNTQLLNCLLHSLTYESMIELNSRMNYLL
jgi:hypothetical protein